MSWRLAAVARTVFRKKQTDWVAQLVNGDATMVLIPDPNNAEVCVPASMLSSLFLGEMVRVASQPNLDPGSMEEGELKEKMVGHQISLRYPSLMQLASFVEPSTGEKKFNECVRNPNKWEWANAQSPEAIAWLNRHAKLNGDVYSVTVSEEVAQPLLAVLE